MSDLFTAKAIGKMEVPNRFVHSATYECMAGKDGRVTDSLVRRYRNIARGGAGLIIPGYMYIAPNGRAVKYQTGIHTDDMIEGLKQLVDTVHAEGRRIVFQLAHSGRQTSQNTIGQTPIAPSEGSRDTIYMAKPRQMTEEQIREAIEAFGRAALRAREAGADGIQLHAAHGYLINQFLSPFFNRRTDAWGGSDRKRFLFLKEVISEIRTKIPNEMPVLVKLNSRDYTPKQGIDLELAKVYAGWLADLPIEGLELSCGTLSYSMFNMVRGDVPTRELTMNFPWWRKILGKMSLQRMEGKFDLEEGYNLEAARLIKPSIGDLPLLVVGGMRRVDHMEQVLKDGVADFISMSRPFIKEPHLVNRIKEGKAISASCTSCNKCFAAVANYMPVACYNKKELPNKKASIGLHE